MKIGKDVTKFRNLTKEQRTKWHKGRYQQEFSLIFQDIAYDAEFKIHLIVILIEKERNVELKEYKNYYLQLICKLNLLCLSYEYISY